jgi:tRNA (guanine37-N1)-methyltransferase
MLRRQLVSRTCLNNSWKRFTTAGDNMPTQTTLDVSPPTIHRGMKGPLDRGAFRKSVTILAARVPATKVGLVLKSETMRRSSDPEFCRTTHLCFLNRSLMNLPKIRNVVANPSDPDGDRLVLLRVSDEGTIVQN